MKIKTIGDILIGIGMFNLLGISFIGMIEIEGRHLMLEIIGIPFSFGLGIILSGIPILIIGMFIGKKPEQINSVEVEQN